MTGPLLATAPTPGALNELAEAEHVARALGTPLMPWQRYFIRVATEYTLNARGQRIYTYPTVLLTVPRQAGKTTVVRVILLTRALLSAGRMAFLTAQSGKDARERFFELVEQIKRSPLARLIHVRAAADSTRLTLANGSRIAPFVPDPDALHGYNFADLLLDEIYALDEPTGDGILGGAVPAMQTHRDRQVILISTKGTIKSTFLNRLLETGRKAVTEAKPGFCYLEWALADGLDAYDPANWDFHPALGHTITKDDIAAATSSMSRGEFERAFMNRTTTTAESVMPMETWNGLVGALDPPDIDGVAFGYEVAHDRSRAAVIAAWRTETGKIAVKPVRAGYGTDWLPDTLATLEAMRPMAIGADKYAQNNVIADARRQADPDSRLVQLAGPEFATASAALNAAVEDGTLVHSGHAGLTYAMATAVTRTYGDAWVFSHTCEPELVAAAVAVRLLTNVPAEVEPVFSFV